MRYFPQNLSAEKAERASSDLVNPDSLYHQPLCLCLAVRGCRPGKIVQMSEAEVRGLCIKSREIFLSQPILLELEAPLKICGEYDTCPQHHPWFHFAFWRSSNGISPLLHTVECKERTNSCYKEKYGMCHWSCWATVTPPLHFRQEFTICLHHKTYKKQTKLR